MNVRRNKISDLRSSATNRHTTQSRAGLHQVCPIVGIGASAGGLEAFTLLLKQLPLDTGFGFVLVQHLDPQHDSALAQLLARATAMPVQEVTNHLRVEANHVYIIPPNRSLSIAQGVLKLQPRASGQVAFRSIDCFFEALAKDQRDRAIGVILSGTATDGTLGLEAIKSEGGLTFAQDDSARYPAMPHHAIAAGCVDFVLSPQSIAKELTRIARHPALVTLSSSPRAATRPRSTPPRNAVTIDDRAATSLVDSRERLAYGTILQLLHQHSGVDFSLYKFPTIYRRIKRRTVLNQKHTLEQYARFLKGNLKELSTLHSDALISVTSFFRNPEVFAVLQRKVFPSLLKQSSTDPLRVWVLGCSTGQEAYSLAMAFTECAEKTAHPRKLQMFATDLNEANLVKARLGFYPKSVAQDISPERLRQFFVEEEDGYRIVQDLRECIVFAKQDLIIDPPFSRMDLISCRNVMIYLNPSLQRKLLLAFHYALKPEGFLFLGASESIGGLTERFAPLDKKQKIFTKQISSNLAFPLPTKNTAGKPASSRTPLRTTALSQPPSGPTSQPFLIELSAEREADRVTVNQFAPPGVLINSDLQILQFRGTTSDYLQPASGKASFDVLKMARHGLMLPLRAVINRAKLKNQIARTNGVAITVHGQISLVNLEVVPLKNLKARCYLVLFEAPDLPNRAQPLLPQSVSMKPVSPVDHKQPNERRIEILERELVEARDYLQSVQENQEAANEELQASNEEGQSTNEELQSLNEELETSKEELESTNEELTTVNEEMVNRNNELNRLNSDLTNFQTSTQLAVILLGRDLSIRRFSSQAEHQFKLVTSDVGRHICDLRLNLEVADLDVLVMGVITSVRECERQVRDSTGRWYMLRIRPYLTLEHNVDGAVLVLMDIDDLKRTKLLIVEAHEHAEAIIRTVPTPLLILSGDLEIKSANEAFYRSFQLTEEETKNRLIYKVRRGAWKFPELRRLLEQIIPQHIAFKDYEVTHHFDRIGRRTLLINASILNETGSKPKEILLSFHDITERKRDEDALHRAQKELAHHSANLESMVNSRTAQLTASNQHLIDSIAKVKASREELRVSLLDARHMQQKLQRLTHQILTAQEEERKKISRELHDEVVQTLIGINVELAALAHLHSNGVPSQQAKIAQVQQLVVGSIDAVHRFARDLRPAVLDDLGLIAALHTYCLSLSDQRKLKIKLTAFKGVEALSNDQQTVLYRVAQEALTNIVRHARATHVRLDITGLPRGVRMEISDNGKAFAVDTIFLRKHPKRLGLVGMKERVEMVNGTFTIESIPGRGTTVRVEIPFETKKLKP